MGDDTERTEEEDLSQNYADPAIAAMQRELVDWQLIAMRAGSGPQHFTTIGMVLSRIGREETSTGRLTLLDAGCGSAYYSEIIDYFTPNMIDYTGCDYNPGMIALAKKRYPNLPIIQTDVCDMQEFEDGDFDIVLSGALIIHVRAWRKALKELARVSYKWLILHRTYVHLDNTPTSREMKDAYGQQVWYQTFNERELLNQVRALDFGMVDIYSTGEGIQHGRVLTYLFRKMERIRDTSDSISVLQPTTASEPCIVGVAAV